MQVAVLPCEAGEKLVVGGRVEDSNVLGSAVCAEQLAGTKTLLERHDVQASCVGTAMTSQSHRRACVWERVGFNSGVCALLLDAVRVLGLGTRRGMTYQARWVFRSTTEGHAAE
jgi:hypothetical protein